MTNQLSRTQTTSVETPAFVLDQQIIDEPNAVLIELPAPTHETDSVIKQSVHISLQSAPSVHGAVPIITNPKRFTQQMIALLIKQCDIVLSGPQPRKKARRSMSMPTSIIGCAALTQLKCISASIFRAVSEITNSKL